MGIRGKDRQIDNIEFNVNDIARSKAFMQAYSAGVSSTTARPIPSSATVV